MHVIPFREVPMLKEVENIIKVSPLWDTFSLSSPNQNIVSISNAESWTG
jgi:hypothetical protein